jgi:hypothetical protein
MEREPTFTLRLRADQPRCLVVFEPLGTWYDLSDDDEVLVHGYGRSTRSEDADVEVIHTAEKVELWLAVEYRAWNKAGIELPV